MAVIRREYLQRVRKKWFVFGTIAGPLFMIGIFAIPIVMGLRNDERERSIAVIDRTDVLYDLVEDRLGVTLDIERVDYSENAAVELDRRVEGQEIFGYLLLDEGTLSVGRAVFRSSDAPSTLVESGSGKLSSSRRSRCVCSIPPTLKAPGHFSTVVKSSTRASGVRAGRRAIEMRLWRSASRGPLCCI
jgi:ABC-type Na+ efflux pump permease subunit